MPIRRFFSSFDIAFSFAILASSFVIV